MAKSNKRRVKKNAPVIVNFAIDSTGRRISKGNLIQIVLPAPDFEDRFLSAKIKTIEWELVENVVSMSFYSTPENKGPRNKVFHDFIRRHPTWLENVSR